MDTLFNSAMNHMNAKNNYCLKDYNFRINLLGVISSSQE